VVVVLHRRADHAHRRDPRQHPDPAAAAGVI